MTDVFDDLAKAFKAGLDAGRSESADEIERLRKENQELKLQYLSDQGQWIEETGRLRNGLVNLIRAVDWCIENDPDRMSEVVFDAAVLARTALREKEE